MKEFIIWPQSGLKITFTKQTQKSLYHIFVLEVSNPNKKIHFEDGEPDPNIYIEYDMAKMVCNAGTNILTLDENFDYGIKEEKLLTRATLAPNKKDKGFVGFLKNDMATNQPILKYENAKIMLDFTRQAYKPKKRGGVNGLDS